MGRIGRVSFSGKGYHHIESAEQELARAVVILSNRLPAGEVPLDFVIPK